MVNSEPTQHIRNRVQKAVSVTIDLEEIIDNIDELTEGAKIWAREHLVLVVLEDD